MAFFQNPFFEEFRGNWVLGDRQQSLSFVVRANNGRSADMVQAFGIPTAGSYDLSGDDSNGVSNGRRYLTINFAYHDLTKFSTYVIDLVGSGSTSQRPDQIVDTLNADGVFSSYFTAELQGTSRVTIRVLTSKADRIRFYISNGGAEEVLLFNKLAGVADIPTYFSRHTVNNVLAFTDSLGSLVALSRRITTVVGGATSTITAASHGLATGDKVVIAATAAGTTTTYGPTAVTVSDANTFTVGVNVTGTITKAFWARAAESTAITNAVDGKAASLGYTIASTKDDWELLTGRSGLFNFQKLTVDGSDRITQIIEYPAGAKAGDLGRKISYTYSGGNTHPSTIAEIPYTLVAADLITP